MSKAFVFPYYSSTRKTKDTIINNPSGPGRTNRLSWTWPPLYSSSGGLGFMHKVCPDLVQVCNLESNFTENRKVARKGYEKPPVGLPWWWDLHWAQALPSTPAGGTLSLCLCLALCTDGLDLDPDLPPGLPSKVSDLPHGYSLTGYWATLTTSPAQPISHSSPLLTSLGLTQVKNIWNVLGKGVVRRNVTPFMVIFPQMLGKSKIFLMSRGNVLWRGCHKRQKQQHQPWERSRNRRKKILGHRRERKMSWSSKYSKCLHIITRSTKTNKKSWKSCYMIKEVTKYL